MKQIVSQSDTFWYPVFDFKQQWNRYS